MTEAKRQRVRRGTRQRWVLEQQGLHHCQCGCGEPIPLRPEHFNAGIPRYLWGHNAKVIPPKPRKELPPSTPCECGCGVLASPGKRFLSGHSTRGRVITDETRQRISAALTGKSFGRGAQARHWKGGRTRTTFGYLDVYAPEHPYAKSGRYVLEHRLIAETELREADPTSEFLTPDGYLNPGADVHHVNEIKHDNRPENLEVMWRGDHTRHHLPALIAARWPR